jgi:hypothetical protein
MTLCRPLPYGLHVAPLERGRQNPRKRYGCLPRARAGQRRDVEPLERVSFVTSGPVWPFPPLCYHPGHCSAIPRDMGARDDKTPPRPPLCVHWPSVSRTLESAYGRRPNGKLPHDHPEAASGQVQDSPRHTAGARFVRTTVNSTVLYTIPPCVALELCSMIVSRLPLAYKRRRRSPSRRERTDSGTLACFRLHHDIDTSPQSNLRYLKASPPLPPRL